jgi:hypothetical protein
MDNAYLKLIGEQTTPLHQMHWVYNAAEPQKRILENATCAVHVGGGYFLTVAHDLRTETGFLRVIPEELYQHEILPKLDGAQKSFLEQCYVSNPTTGKKYLTTADHQHADHLTKIFKQKRFDTRRITLSKKNVCKPYLVVQFKNSLFYNDVALTHTFDQAMQFTEVESNKHNFLVELELVLACYPEDVAVFRAVGLPDQALARIPSVPIGYLASDKQPDKLLCLQNAPFGSAGRLINKVSVLGVIDHYEVFHDDVGGNYSLDGYRYLVEGYLSKGTSGAPYLLQDGTTGKYRVIALQSESGSRHFGGSADGGNCVSVATPLSLVKDELTKLSPAQPPRMSEGA